MSNETKNLEELAQPVAWPNGCNHSAIAALRYLAEKPRPAYGNSPYNTEHLYMIAGELTRMSSQPLYSQEYVDALKAERDAARNAIAAIYKSVTGENPEWSNWTAYLDDIVEEADAAVRQIQAQAVEDAVKHALSVDTIASTAVISHLLRHYAAELRERKE